MSSIWTKALLILAGVWLIAGGAIWWARSSKATPETIVQYVETHPLAGLSESERAKRLERVADQLNRLEYEQRREVRMSRKLDEFFRALTPAEQARFLEQTLPAGFTQMMDALNKMEPQKRQKFVERALREMQQQEGGALPEGMAENLDANARKIMNQGLKSFYSEASADTKMDLAPLIEQMQKNLQGL